MCECDDDLSEGYNDYVMIRGKGKVHECVYIYDLCYV